MVIKNCSSIVVAVVTVVIGEITKDEGREYMVKEQGGKFFFTTSKKAAAQLQVGEQVTLICEPVPSFDYTKQVFFLARKNGARTEVLVGSGTDWYDVYLKSFTG
ncbi:hypothetical protein HGA34_04165 [Candidatus Falkowbacteria bacterium]|nr:hypothetical protein [Candidatus Falkowbacteria bacterium]